MHDGAAISTTGLKTLDQAMGIAEFSLTGVVLRANANYASIMGYGQQEMIGLNHRDLCFADYVNSRAYTEWYSPLSKGEVLSGVCKRMRKDGSSCWLEATYAPVRNELGKLTHILQIATDISERIRLERAQQEKLQQLSLVADTSDAAVVIGDGNWVIKYVNAGFSRMFGWTLAEAVGRTPITLLAPHVSVEFTKSYRDALRAGLAVHREEIVVGKNGERYWVNVQSNPVMSGNGQLQTTITVLTDITQAKMHEVLQQHALEAMARDFPLKAVLDLICLEVERIAPEIAVSILEIDENKCLQTLSAPSLPPSYSAALDGVMIGSQTGSRGSAAFYNQEVLVSDIMTDPLWTDFKHLVLPLGYTACWSTPIRTTQGDAAGTFVFYYRKFSGQVTNPFHQQLAEACSALCTLAFEREYSRRRIRQLAFYDGLTNLPNRSLLHAQADTALANAARNNDELAVVFIDLDRFKQVNDSMGHSAGDELLRTMALRLQSHLRNGDIIGRLSGDEFAAILPKCDIPHAADLVDRLLTSISGACTVSGVTLACSASCGIAMFPTDGRDMETLLQRADMAMYQSKSNGGGRFSFFSAELNQLVQESLSLEVALRQALKDETLHLHYQPQINLNTGELYGVEALARWVHEEFGQVSPARFIPLAEECGLIEEIGQWVLNESCRQLKRWRDRGISVPIMAVNLSATNFHNLTLPILIEETLRFYDLKPSDLTIEITEHVLLDNNPSTLNTIEAIHHLGVRLSVDDFGTGYSSLGCLRSLPICELKMDRGFVADLAHDQAAKNLSAAILGIGQSLHLTVVAEGVETEAQCAILREQGYPIAQGYLFSPPLSSIDFEQWIGSTCEALIVQQ